jgi:hypothetical protein
MSPKNEEESDSCATLIKEISSKRESVTEYIYSNSSHSFKLHNSGSGATEATGHSKDKEDMTKTTIKRAIDAIMPTRVSCATLIEDISY